MKYATACAIAALALSGCASTPDKITTTPAPGGAVVHLTNSTVIQDLQSAAANLDQAVLIGALSPDDPARQCMHDVLIRTGIEQPPGAATPQSFVPKNDGLASLGAIAYILAQQAKQVAGQRVPVAVECEALLGRVVMDGATNVVRSVPFASRLLGR
jgi:hypothetical protein